MSTRCFPMDMYFGSQCADDGLFACICCVCVCVCFDPSVHFCRIKRSHTHSNQHTTTEFRMFTFRQRYLKLIQAAFVSSLRSCWMRLEWKKRQQQQQQQLQHRLSFPILFFITVGTTASQPTLFGNWNEMFSLHKHSIKICRWALVFFVFSKWMPRAKQWNFTAIDIMTHFKWKFC